MKPINATGWTEVKNATPSKPISAEGWTEVVSSNITPAPKYGEAVSTSNIKETIPMAALRDVTDNVTGLAKAVNTGAMQAINVFHPDMEKNTLAQMGKMLYEEYKNGTITEDAMQTVSAFIIPTLDRMSELSGKLLSGDISGAAGQVARAPLTTALDIVPLLKAAKPISKGAASVAFGPSVENIGARISDSAGIKNARSFSEIAQDVPSAFSRLDDKIGEVSKSAIETLDKTKGYKANKVLQIIEETREDVVGKVISDADELAAKTIDRYAKRVKKEYAGRDISQYDTKRIIQKLDKDIDYNAAKSDTANRAVSKLRQRVDKLLKDDNPEYKAAMLPVDNLMNLLGDSKTALGIKRIGGEYVLTNTVEGKISALNKPNAMKSQSMEVLKSFGDETGLDILGEAKNFRIKQMFDKEYPQGSSRANVGTALGAGLGAIAAGPKGAGIGGAIGGGIGMGLDKYGGKILGRTLDSTGPALNLVGKAIDMLPGVSVTPALISRAIEQERKDHPGIPEEHLPTLVSDELKKDAKFYDKEAK